MHTTSLRFLKLTTVFVVEERVLYLLELNSGSAGVLRVWYFLGGGSSSVKISISLSLAKKKKNFNRLKSSGQLPAQEAWGSI